jgi:hypothetical protein
MSAYDIWEDDAPITPAEAQAMLDAATPGKRVQFHGSYCKEAVGTPFTDWDTSHEVSVIRVDGSRLKLAQYKHAGDAALSQAAPDLARAFIAATARAEAAEARVAELTDFITEFAAAKIDALPSPRVRSPEDEPDPVVAADDVWAWQEDARALLKGATP